MIILIDGYWGSGKTVLVSLLDGHPNLFVSILQDSIPGVFAMDDNDPLWYKYKDTTVLRKLLASKSRYYRIELFSSKGKIHLDVSSDDRIYNIVDIDFYKFDKMVFSNLLKLNCWKPEIICETIYECLYKSWKNYPIKSEKLLGYVTHEDNRPATLLYFIKNFPNGKLLYTIRSPEGIIATLSNRKPIKELYTTESRMNLSAKMLVECGYVQRIMDNNNLAKDLEKKFPDRIKTLKFEDAVENTESTMRSVAAFLNIPYNHSMTVATHLGKEITSKSGKKYVGKINDVPENILDIKDIKLIKALSGKQSLLELFINPLITIKSYKIRIKLFSREFLIKIAKLIKKVLFNIK